MRIDEMPAGIEMDKAISQHVFGNTEFVCRNCEDDYHVVDRQGLTAYIPVPRYSTDIAAAWEVWDILKNKYHELILSWCDDMYDLLVCDSKGHYLFSSEADTAPLAICRCALKAMGVTEC